MSSQSVDAVQAVAPGEGNAEIVVKGRNVEVPDHFRVHVGEKLSRLERYDSTIYMFDVELYHEPNRRQRKSSQHVDITARGKGPVIRGEASAENFYAALELALTKLQKRLRRSKDRRKIHYGEKTPVALHEAAAIAPAFEPNAASPEDIDAVEAADAARDHAEPGQVVRVKDHESKPMTVDDALYEMELVGHDFFLFYDKETEKPSVVYRRHAFDYGLIRLV